MNIRVLHLLLFIAITPLVTSCWIEEGEGGPNGPNGPNGVPYEIGNNANLPSGNSMDAQSVDLDNDGDLDIVVAIEFGPNRLLLNDGSGFFQDFSAGRLPAYNFNSNDIAVANFNTAGFDEIFFANAATQNTQQTNEFYINQGNATFLDRLDLIPVIGVSRAASAADFDNDGDPDLIIGNNGQNNFLFNSSTARLFSNNTELRLPQILDITNDIAVGDLNGNGWLDLVIANEDDNRILINTGSGFFSNQTSSRLPLISGIEETREVDLRDVDGDGDLDIYFSNVQINESGANPQDRLLINDGEGVFEDVTSEQLPEKITNTVDSDFMDIDNDGDWDILTGNLDGGIQVFVNDGTGNYTDETENWIPEDFAPFVMDFDVADFNNDGLPDIYIATYQSTDQLLIRTRE